MNAPNPYAGFIAREKAATRAKGLIPGAVPRIMGDELSPNQRAVFGALADGGPQPISGFLASLEGWSRPDVQQCLSVMLKSGHVRQVGKTRNGLSSEIIWEVWK